MSLTTRSTLRLSIVLGLLLLAGGCAALAVAARAVPQRRPAVYKGLAGQSVGVMVWADRALRMDWDRLPVDLATLIQAQLQKAQQNKADELKGTTFPVAAASIARYQRDHPEIETIPITEVAPKLGVSRLIYVEIEKFSTRSESSLQLFRGSATATLRVIEVANGQGKEVYTENNVSVVFPPKSPPESVLNANDVLMYRGTLARLAEEIVWRFVTTEVERD
ncbi:hypothetical protein [Fontivita pretiosa]|uniref:hypothetical protein n=1 Tax=Fontivita pretiosa TaxID=2989684 RepID=UPI003D182EAC